MDPAALADTNLPQPGRRQITNHDRHRIAVAIVWVPFLSNVLFNFTIFFSNPTPDDSLGAKWIPYSLENKDYMDIGNELKTGNAPDEEELQFWENILIESGQKDN